MRLPLIALLLVFAGPAAAQTAAALVEASRVEMRRDPEASRRYAEQALVMLAERPDPDLAVRAHIQLCEYHYERDLAAARQAANAARALLPRVTRGALKSSLLACEGEIHELAGENAVAMAIYQQAVEVAEALADQEALGEALYRRGYLRGVQGEYARGLADLKRAVKLFEQLGLRQQMRISINGVATLYSRLGDWQQARQYYEAALRDEAAGGLTRERAITHHNLARVLEQTGDWDAAQQHYETVLALSRQLPYPRGEAFALRGLAAVNNAREQYGAALKLVRQGSRLLAPETDRRLHAQFMLQRGIAERGKGQTEDSLVSLKAALEDFARTEAQREVAATHRELSRSLAAQGEWRAAYEEQLAAATTTEKMQRQQLDQSLASARIEFDMESRDRENALLQREKEAGDRALDQERRAARLQTVVLALVGLLAAMLAAVAWRRHRSSREMHALAMTDELTGLPNRRQVLSRVTEMIASTQGCALLIIDVDHFKVINDRIGHLAGDEVLRAVATVLRHAAREPCALGRIGGEEFVLAAPGLDAAGAAALAERVVGEVRALDCSAWMPGARVTVSVGLTIAQTGDTVSELLRRADGAMYAAKDAGRDRVEIRLAAPLRAVGG